MLEMKDVNDAAYRELIRQPPRHWSKSRFSYTSKCDVSVNNMFETFNSIIVGAREKPIVTMLEDIKTYLMERWANNRAKMLQFTNDILPRIKHKIDQSKSHANVYQVSWSRNSVYEVKHIRHNDKFIMDLRARECNYRRWMLTGKPCNHAVACMIQVNESTDTYIPAIYRKQAYANYYNPIIFPTCGKNIWETV